jgi:hypothetical protein
MHFVACNLNSNLAKDNRGGGGERVREGQRRERRGERMKGEGRRRMESEGSGCPKYAINRMIRISRFVELGVDNRRE